ncbi:hypothetical protein GD3902_14645 [Geobacillus thermodenitrificans]|nr:hypothetical protein GD3902_14645 [Geobacillus thermodenitrificans]
MQQWATSSRASLETEMKVQRLLKLPTALGTLRITNTVSWGRAMEGVNRIPRQRGYEARDREEIMKKAKYLHEEGYRHVKIAMMLGISRGTLMRWNKEQGVFQTRAPGEAGKLAVKNIVITRTVFLISEPRIRLILRLNRKYEIFSSLMI